MEAQNLIILQNAFSVGLSQTEAGIEERKRHYREYSQKAIKFISENRSANLEGLLRPCDLALLIDISNLLVGHQLETTSINSFLKLGKKPERAILINVVSKQPACLFCTAWVESVLHQEMISLTNVKELVFDWSNPDPNPIIYCLLGINKDLSFYPSIILIEKENRYLCRDIWAERKKRNALFLNPLLRDLIDLIE